MATFNIRPTQQQDIIDTRNRMGTVLNRKSSGWTPSPLTGLPPKKSDLFSETATANVVHFNGWRYDFNGYVKYIEAQDITIPSAPTATPVTDATIASATKGQFFVLDEELVTTLTNYTQPYETFTVSGNVATSLINTTGDGALKTNALPLVLGRTYVITLDITLNSGTLPLLHIGNSSSVSGGDVSNYTLNDGINVLTFKYQTDGYNYLWLYNQVSTVDFAATISVKLKDDKYQCIQAATSQELTNTTYFRPVEQITAQDIVIPKYDVTTDTVSWETALTDTSLLYLDYLHKMSKGYSDIDLMTAYGFSNGTTTYTESHLYTIGSDDTILYGAPVLLQRLNQGRYSPFVNELGVYENATSQAWYVANDMNNTYTAFTSIGTDNGRPDVQTATKTYLNQIIANPAFSQTPANWATKVRNMLINGTWDYGVGGNVFTEQLAQTTSGSVTSIEVQDGTKYRIGDVLQIWDVTAGSSIGRRTVNSISSNTLTLKTAITKTGTNVLMISGGQSSVLNGSYKTASEFIASPAYLPQILKDALASGRYVNIGINVEDDVGNSLIPDGILDNFKLVLGKYVSVYGGVRSTDCDTNPTAPTWASFTPTATSSTNALTMTNEPTGNIVLAQYQARVGYFNEPATVDLLELDTQTIITNSHETAKGNLLTFSSIGKIGTNDTDDEIQTLSLKNIAIDANGDPYIQTNSNNHEAMALNGVSTPAVKTFFGYGIDSNGQETLTFFSQECIYGVDWGDTVSAQYDNLTNGTATDDNAATVITSKLSMVIS